MPAACTGFNFLNLPYELRLHVYGVLAQDSIFDGRIDITSQDVNTPINYHFYLIDTKTKHRLFLLEACRQIRREALQSFASHASAQLHIEEPSGPPIAAAPLSHLVPERIAQHLRTIHLTWRDRKEPPNIEELFLDLGTSFHCLERLHLAGPSRHRGQYLFRRSHRPPLAFDRGVEIDRYDPTFLAKTDALIHSGSVKHFLQGTSQHLLRQLEVVPCRKFVVEIRWEMGLVYSEVPPGPSPEKSYAWDIVLVETPLANQRHKIDITPTSQWQEYRRRLQENPDALELSLVL